MADEAVNWGETLLVETTTELPGKLLLKDSLGPSCGLVVTGSENSCC
jgi:hypothetical protein